MSSSELRVPIAFEPAEPAAAGGFVPDPLPAAGGGFRAPGEAARPGTPGPAQAAETAAPPPPEPLEAQLARAFEEGRAAGRAELPWESAEALERAAGALSEAVVRVDALRRGYLLSNRRVVVELALAIAERLVRRTLQTDVEALSEAVRRALDAVPATEAPVQVRVSPADLAVLEAGGDALRARLGDAALDLVADTDLEPGDVCVVAGASRVDARVAALVQRLAVELEDALGAPAPAEGPAAETPAASAASGAGPGTAAAAASAARPQATADRDGAEAADLGAAGDSPAPIPHGADGTREGAA